MKKRIERVQIVKDYKIQNKILNKQRLKNNKRRQFQSIIVKIVIKIM